MLLINFYFLQFRRGKWFLSLSFGLCLFFDRLNFLGALLPSNLSELLVPYLQLLLNLTDMVLQNMHSLVVDGILVGRMVDQILDEGMLLHDDCVHAHAHFVESVVEQELALLELFDLAAPAVRARVHRGYVLLEFAHQVVHCLLAAPQLAHLSLVARLDLLFGLDYFCQHFLGSLVLPRNFGLSYHFRLNFSEILKQLTRSKLRERESL